MVTSLDYKIYVFKLTTGEEIIAKIENINETELKISNARSIIATPSGELAFGPILFSADKEKAVLLNRDSIIAISEHISDNFMEIYTKATSGLVLPKSNILME
jgi:hypothetical protein